MTSTQTQPSYDYTRPSTTATRAIVSSDTPIMTGQVTPSDPSSPHGTLHRRKTNNYETALADRVNTTIDQTANMSLEHPSSSTSATSHPGLDGSDAHADTSGPTVVGSVAYVGDAAAAHVCPTDKYTQPARPGVGGALGRQQSWKRDDLKRVNMERMLSSDARRGGYSTAV
ncbi:hypothetical protein MBLNU457_g2648t1 [Dothideomycetes sp. NU457]